MKNIVFIGDRIEVYEELWWGIKNRDYELQIVQEPQSPDQFCGQDQIDLIIACTGICSSWHLQCPNTGAELNINGSSEAGVSLIQKWFRGDMKKFYGDVPVLMLTANPGEIEALSSWKNYGAVLSFRDKWRLKVYEYLQRIC